MRITIRTGIAISAGVLMGLLTQVTAADTLSRILKEKKLHVVTEAAMPPLEFIQDGKIVGLGKDILDYIVKKNNFELIQTNLPWQGVLPGLNAKRFDFVATSVTITPERAKNYAFTIPVDEATTYAIKRKSNKSINSIEDVNGKVGGTQLGSGTERSVRLWDKSQKDAGRKGLSELKLYSTYPEMYLGVANGEIDVGFHTLTALNSLMKNKPDTYTLIDRVSDQTYYSWLTRPEDASLRDFLNSHIKELIVSGKMAELQQKWFGKSTKLPLEGYLPPGAH